MIAVPAMARNYVRDVLVDREVGFNRQFVDTADEYGIRSFKLDWDVANPNLYLGRYTLAALAVFQKPELMPCAVLSVFNWDSIGKRNLKVTPSTFSGDIICVVDFFTATESLTPPDGDAMFFALSDAMLQAFNSPASYAAFPPGLSYNNEIKGEPGNLESDGSRWSQMNTFVMIFGRIG